MNNENYLINFQNRLENIQFSQASTNHGAINHGGRNTSMNKHTEVPYDVNCIHVDTSLQGFECNLYVQNPVTEFLYLFVPTQTITMINVSVDSPELPCSRLNPRWSVITTQQEWTPRVKVLAFPKACDSINLHEDQVLLKSTSNTLT